MDDADLVNRARAGCADAYDMLIARHRPQAYRVALRLVNNPADAEDVAQDALIAAWRSLAYFRGEAAFSTWLYRIVTTRAINARHRGRRENLLEHAADIADLRRGPADEVEGSQACDAVDAAIASLPRVQRIALVLHHFENLSYREIATMTTSTVPAVRSHIHRARRTLATQLREWR